MRRIDRLVLGYLAIATVVAAVRMGDRPLAAWVLLINGLLATLLGLTLRPDLGRFGRLLRDIYPVAILPALYASLDLINGFDVRVWDDVVQGWEAALFGEQISREWWQRSPSHFWSTTLHAVYFTYYFIVPFPALYFLVRGARERARDAVALVAATFLACYVFFLLLPVAGPYYEFPRPVGPFVENWAARLVYGTLSTGSSYGAAFPSSHVAAMLAATVATWRGAPRLGIALMVPTLALAIGVVYCQMHYAVDAMAGIAIALVMAAIMRGSDARR